MTAKTTTERKAAERKRLREQGLRPIEVWAKPEHHAAIRAYVKQLDESK